MRAFLAVLAVLLVLLGAMVDPIFKDLMPSSTWIAPLLVFSGLGIGLFLFLTPTEVKEDEESDDLDD